MEDKLLEKINDLNIKDTKLLLEENIDLSIDSVTRKRIEKRVMNKTGYYEKQPKNKNKINNFLGGIIMKKKIALALSAAFILSLAGGGYAYAKNPVAYVSVDINPSVELGVNAFDTVVSVEAYNEDGSNILEGTDLLNIKVDEAVSVVVTNAINDGYIKEDGSSAIEITTSTDKTEVASELDETLKDVVDETLNNNNVEAEVETENVALARRDEARKLGITPGKLNLIQKLQALDPAITVDEYKNSSVKDIQKKTKELRKNGVAETSTQEGTSTTTTSTEATTDTSDTAATSTTENNTGTEAVVSTEADTNEEEIVDKGNKKTSNDKNNNGNNKKEEVNTIQEQISEPVVEKQNKSENSNSQSSNSSSKEDKSNDIKSDNGNNNSSSKSENSSKDNSSKSDSSSSGNGSSNSQGKGKNK